MHMSQVIHSGQILRAAFQQRRKMLRQSLKAILLEKESTLPDEMGTRRPGHMHACIYAYIHTSMHTFIHTSCIHTHTYIYILYAYVHTNMCIHLCTNIQINMSICLWNRVRVYTACMQTHIRTRAYRTIDGAPGAWLPPES
jgi:hypothetical protein